MKKAVPFVLSMALLTAPTAVLANNDGIQVKGVFELNLSGTNETVQVSPDLKVTKTLELKTEGISEDIDFSGKEYVVLTFKTESGATSEFKLKLPSGELTTEQWQELYAKLGIKSDNKGTMTLEFSDGTEGTLHITALDNIGNLRFEMQNSDLHVNEDVMLNVSKLTFDISSGEFEKEIQLDSVTTLDWTFVKGDATADFNITLPGKQTPATDWKDAFVDLNAGTALDLDISKANAIPLQFSDGSQGTLNLMVDVIGNSGKVRFWIESENDVKTTVKEDGLHLDLGAKGNYIIWINGKKFGTVTNDNSVVLNKYLLKGNNRITCELVDADFKPFNERKIFKLYTELDASAQATLGNLLANVDIGGILKLLIPTVDGKTANGNVDITIQLDTDEPMVKGEYYVWVDNSTKPIVTTDVKATLENLSPGTHEVKVELRDENDRVVAGASDTFVVPTQSGGTLPDTATPWANVMGVGAALMGLGVTAIRKLKSIGK